MLRPARAFPWIGLAVAHLNAGRAEEAARLLERAAHDLPPPAGNAEGVSGAGERATLDAFRGLALQLAGRSAESRRALDAAGEHPLARRLLDTPPLPPSVQETAR